MPLGLLGPVQNAGHLKASHRLFSGGVLQTCGISALRLVSRSDTPHDNFLPNYKSETQKENKNGNFSRTTRNCRTGQALNKELKISNPAEYSRIAAELGIKPGYRAPGGIAVKHYVEAQQQFDSPTLIKMAKFDKDFCGRWYKGQLTAKDMEFFNAVVPMNPDAKDKLPSIARLRNEAPSVFADIETAALAHKVISGPRRPAVQPEVKPADDGRVPLGERLAAVVGLPEDYRVTSEEYLDVLSFANAQAASKV